MHFLITFLSAIKKVLKKTFWYITMKCVVYSVVRLNPYNA